jgi:hypothetical protein
VRGLPAFCALTLLVAFPVWGAERLNFPRQNTGPYSTPQVEDEDIFEGGGIDTVYTTDSDHFRSARLRVGALVHYKSPYDVIAVGGGGTYYEQNDWSKERYTLAAAVRKLDRATGAGVVATAGVSSVGDHQKLFGEGTWNVRLSQATGLEFIGQRDFVETRAALDAGTMTNYLAASVDHAPSDRFTVIGLAGVQWFSDDNQRTHLRGRAIYAVLPEQGLSVQVRAQGYESSSPGGGLYFNPDRYERADIGLRLRRSIADWRVLAAVGGGQEWIDHTVRNPTSYAEARGQRSFANNLTLALTFAYYRASEADSAGSGAYNWRYFRVLFIIPLGKQQNG